METRFLAVAGLLLALLGARIFAPFLGTLLAAASVALVLAPLQKTWVGRAPRAAGAGGAARPGGGWGVGGGGGGRPRP